jgi:uncharacterized protein (DUF362 family)
MAPSVYMARLSRGYPGPLREGLSFTGFWDKVRPGRTVILKPNLTFPEFRPGVMTGLPCLEALIVLLKERGADIAVVEGDGGGYNKFKMEEVFRATGLAGMARRYGAKVINLSRQPSRAVHLYCGKREAWIALPELLLEDRGPFISLPVPKVHYLTGVSLALKNQWGCLPDPHRRVALHPQFDWLIWEVNRRLSPDLVVMDGRYGLNRNGPLRGRVEDTNWLLVADEALAADVLACRLMGVNPRRIPHLDHVLSHHLDRRPEDIHCNADYRAFAGPRFHLRRELWDYPGYLCFRLSWLNALAYRSPLADLLHKGLYLFRREFYNYSRERARYSKAEWSGDRPKRPPDQPKKTGGRSGAGPA